MAILSSNKTPSLLTRLTLLSFFWCLVTLFTAGYVLIQLFDDHLKKQARTEVENQILQLVTLTRYSRSGELRLTGSLTEPRFEQPFSGWSWQIRLDERVLAQSSSLGPMTGGSVALLEAPIGNIGVFESPLGDRLLGMSRNLIPRFSRVRLTFAVATPLAELDEALSEFRLALMIALALLGLGQILTVFLLIHAGFGPLKALREKIISMRQGVKNEAESWPKELAPVAAELDALDVHVHRLVNRARGQAADLAHAIKTPLTVIQQSCETLPENDMAPILRQSERIKASLDRHLTRMRAGGVRYAKTKLLNCVEDIALTLGRHLSDKAIDLHISVSDELFFYGDETDLFEILGNLLDNAQKWAISQIAVSSWMADNSLKICIEDDGPGIAREEIERISRRGYRLDETVEGQGLGIDIVKDLCALYGGNLVFSRSDMGGLRVEISFPNA